MSTGETNEGENMNESGRRNNQTPLSVHTSFTSEFNTNVSDYTLDDILSMIEVNASEYENYDSLKEAMNAKIDKYVGFFDQLQNYKLSTFFKEVRVSLFGKQMTNVNITEAQKLLEIYTDRDSIREAKDKHLIQNNTNIQRDTVTKLLTIDSRFRSNYADTLSTDYNMNLPYIINNVTELRLSDVEFPATFYPLQDDYENNYFWLKYTYTYNYTTDDTFSQTKYIYFYVPSGNYYQATLIAKLQEPIDAEGLPLVVSHDLSFDNDGGVGDGTGRVTIEYTGDTANSVVITDMELNFNASKLLDSEYNHNTSHVIDSSNAKIDKYYNTNSIIGYKQRMGWMMGFRSSLYSNSTSFTSEGQLDIIGPRYIYLIVNDFNTSSNVNFFSNRETSLLSDNILGRISLKTFAFSVQAQNDFIVYGEPRYFFGPVNIDKLEVKVVDEFGRTINLNNMDFSFSLQMTVKYDVSIAG